MTDYIKMQDLDLNNQRVLIREDLNVPIKNGIVTNDKRIEAALPTIKQAMKAGAKIMLMSHLGRPEEGHYDAQYSLEPVANRLSELLGHNVKLVENWLEQVPQVQSGEVVLLENVRFNRGEKNNDSDLAQQMAAMCDVFVMDAFGTAHRAQASTYGVAQFAKIACAGPLLVSELNALDKIFKEPKPPLMAIVGGSKVSTKLTVLKHLFERVECLIVGGGIANTFIAAAGYNVGQSLFEPDLVDQAQELMVMAKARNIQLPIPIDVVTAKEFSDTAQAQVKAVDQVADDDFILDIGPQTAQQYASLANSAGTIVWNGPVGVFEIPAFANGTKALSQAIAQSEAFSVAGGGDTLAAIDQFNIADNVSYISTGGGAFLEYLEGKKLPAIDILQKRASS